jgi:hypothetical protein
MPELDVHHVQGFLHMLDVRGAVADQHASMADEGAEDADIIGGAEGALKQTVSVELLDPLAVENVGLATWDILDMAGVDQENLKTALVEDFVDRDPIDAGGLHGHGVDAAGLEPISQVMQGTGIGLEAPDGLCATAFGHSDIDLGRTDVETGSVEIDLLEGFKLDDFPLFDFLAFSCHCKNLLFYTRVE